MRAARSALLELSQHTLARQEQAERLFVEGYFMRGLVAAHEVLAQPGPGAGTPPRSGAPELLQAISFADSLLALQNEHGYWRIGYASSWLADMGAALGLFAALEKHVAPEHLQRYTSAVEKFMLALKRDHLILASGGLGVGLPIEGTPSEIGRTYRSNIGWSDQPYLVSTALVGIEQHAWLFHRTGKPEYRERAVQALEYTLSQIQPDGSLPTLAKHESPLAASAYVQEGWMAADVHLAEPQILERLRQALPKHVDWLLKKQRPDGTWNMGLAGDYARTPGIVDFLIWYDQRCETRPDVREAIRRASGVFVDRKRREAYLFAPDEQGDKTKTQEILRAISGRPLAALASGGFVL